MIPGTGPGRGTPWWRSGHLLILRQDGDKSEPVGIRREGRTVAVIGKKK